MTLDLQIIPAELASVCREHHIRRLSIFGSAARGELRPASDVDVLADFDPDQTPSYFELVEICDQLSALLGGRTVDLVTPAALHRLIRPEVMRQAQVIYEG